MNRVKIHFQLMQDEDGYPGVAVESVWAEPTMTAHEYVLDNVPFFVRDATLGDVVSVREEWGDLWYLSTSRESKNSLLRIALFDPSSSVRIVEYLSLVGCVTEYSAAHSILAVSVPSNAKLHEIQAFLQAEAAAGVLDFEEPLLRY
jgi:hypothetical protein